MQPKKRRGRVAGRVLAKEIAPSASFDNLFRKATAGDFPRGFQEIAEAWHEMDEQREALEDEGRGLGTRWINSLVKWLAISRGKRVNPKRPIGYTPDEVLKGAKKDKSREEEVYRWLQEYVAFDLRRMKLFAKIDAHAGYVYRWAIETRDLRPLRLLEAEVKLILEGHDCADVRHAAYLLAIGKDERGQLHRTTSLSTSSLARGLPQGLLGQAVDYALKRWEALTRFATCQLRE